MGVDNRERRKSMRIKSYLIGTALLAAVACAQQRKPSEELFQLADSYYEELMHPYRTSRGVLRSEPPDKYSHRFDISLTNDGHVLHVAYAVMGHEARLQLVADNNGIRKVYFYNKEGHVDMCSFFPIDSSGSPFGQVTEGKGSECEKAAEPFMADFIAALKEYERQR